jgi:hypothetical protein
MLSFLKKLFGFGSTAATEVTEVAPYKIEAPRLIVIDEVPAAVVLPVTRKKKAAPKKVPALVAVAAKKPRAKKAPKA